MTKGPTDRGIQSSTLCVKFQFLVTELFFDECSLHVILEWLFLKLDETFDCLLIIVTLLDKSFICLPTSFQMIQ